MVYARGTTSPYKEPCRAILARIANDPTAFGVDVELLQELLDVYSRRGSRRRGSALVTDVLVAFPEPFPVTRREVEEAADILVIHPRLSPRDAIHAAVVLSYGLEGIVSADKAFDHVPGVARFDPLKLADP